MDERERARAEIQAMWDGSLAAMRRRDLDARMRIFADDYHARLPDGSTQDRAAMERYIRSQHESIVDVDPASGVVVSDVDLSGDIATVRTHQRFIRRVRLPDGSIVERRHWADHREEWVRTADGWRYRSADVTGQGRIADDGTEQRLPS